MDRDTFHQVEGLHGKNKMNSGYGGFTSTKPRAYHRQHWSKSQTSWNVDGRRGYTRKSVPEIKREFRVVRDNRTSQNVIADATESFQKSHEDKHQGSSIGREQSSSSGSVVDHYHTTTKNSNGHDLCQKLNGRSDSGPGLKKKEKSSESDIESSTKEKTMTELGTSIESSKEVKNNTQPHTPNSIIGVYSSSLDPVHLPSSRPAGTVGTIGRKVGVVGVRRHVIDASNSFSTSLSEQDASSVSKPTISNLPISRSFVTSHHLAKPHQQDTGHQKGINTNMEWKPKSNRKPNADDCAILTNQVQPTGSSKKLPEVNLSNNKHVIIPEHLKVTKSEQADLIFGSFGVSGSDVLTSTESPSNNPSASKSSSESVAIKDSDTDQSNLVESQVRASHIHDSSYAVVKHQLSVQINDDYALSTRDIESYPDAELNQKHVPSYTSFEPQRQNCSSFSELSAYEPQMMISMPFTKMTMQGNVQLQGSRSGQEITSSQITNSNPASITSLRQQQQPPIQQLSPNYANLVPYRQISPQMYFPQMLMPNYSNISVQNNPPSNRSNYLMMPGGSPQLATESMKYKPSVQSVPPTIGYGSYSSLGMYAFGNTTGMIDVSGINYSKDNNLYVPNPQVQSENGMWIQNPREVSTFRPTPCYNMPGQQSPSLQTFMPANQALNQPAYPSSQLQYTGFYPSPPQPGSVVGGPSNPPVVNSAFGMIPASPTQVVGPYQQHQLGGGHLGWTTANF